MPTTIYDSFIITQRIQNKTIADSFINRIQSQTNPTTGSAPALGITSASIINSVEEGQQKDIRKNYGCTTVNAGCPCALYYLDLYQMWRQIMAVLLLLGMHQQLA
jgi:hypothetical protein